jgi:hypothetical protein
MLSGSVQLLFEHLSLNDVVVFVCGLVTCTANVLQNGVEDLPLRFAISFASSSFRSFL